MRGSFKIGDWLVEPELNRVSCGQREIHLEPKIMAVLLLLAEQPGTVISKESLITSVWHNSFVTEQVLTNAIWELRKALGDEARSPTYIQTVPKKGYRLIAAVSNNISQSLSSQTVPAQSHPQSNYSFLLIGSRRAVAIGAAITIIVALTGLMILRAGLIRSRSEMAKMRAQQQAQAAYAKGLEQFQRRTHAGLLESLNYFEEAIRLHPAYAPAHAYVAANYILLVPKAMKPVEGYSKARAAAVRAIELNPQLSEAHSALAMVKVIFERDWAEADREFQLAVRLDPQNVLARTWYAKYLMAANRLPAAMEQINTACSIAPNSVEALATAGEIFRRNGQDDEALRAFQKVIELDPDHIYAHNGLGNIYHKRLLLEQARREYQKVMELMGEPAAETLARDFVDREKRTSQLLISKLNVLLKQKNVAPTQIARIFAGFNDREKAFYWLERGYQEWDAGLIHLKIDDSWDNLRDDPRFASLMHRVGIIN